MAAQHAVSEMLRMSGSPRVIVASFFSCHEPRLLRSYIAMDAINPDSTSPADDLLGRAHGGDPQALGGLFELYRERLRLLVRLRLDRRLQGRIDPSDVIQDAYLEAADRFPDYLHQPDMPFFLWLRFLTAQRLLIL